VIAASNREDTPIKAATVTAGKAETDFGPRVRKPFVMLPVHVAADDTLSAPARLVYALLLDHARTHGHCWPGQELLAARLGVSTRQLRRYLRELETAGLIQTRRTGRNNVYALPDVPDQEAPPLAGRSDRTSMSDQTGHPCPIAYKVEADERSSSSAAAAETSSTAATVAALVEAMQSVAPDLSRERAEFHAAQTPGLVGPVVQHCRERFRDPSKPRINNPTGYVLAALREPAAYLVRGPSGDWEAPSTQRAPARSPAEIAEADRHRREEYARREAEANQPRPFRLMDTLESRR
jgi:hypothetical protein